MRADAPRHQSSYDLTHPCYDLASLTKPLVTAPLALAFLDLDADRRWALGFQERGTPLTVRQLLSHSSGLPPWRPFTGEPVAVQLRREVSDVVAGLGPATTWGSTRGCHACVASEGAKRPGGPPSFMPEHPLLRPATPGLATYSDLNYRLLAELLEAETSLPFARLGAASGLSPAPWPAAPAEVPDGPDAVAWALTTELPLPPRERHLPHDANARAGMRGHAGFGTTATQLRQALARWVAAGWPARMAREVAEGEGGTRWGLGLQVAFSGPGQFGQLLSKIPLGQGIAVIEAPTEQAPQPAPALEDGPGPPSDVGAGLGRATTWGSTRGCHAGVASEGAKRPGGPPSFMSGWWFHLGYTGPALFFRPSDASCLALLLHRRGPAGELLDAEALRARRWELLSRFVGQSGG